MSKKKIKGNINKNKSNIKKDDDDFDNIINQMNEENQEKLKYYLPDFYIEPSKGHS